MRVAQVNLQKAWGGAENHVLLLSQGLREAGAEVVVCCHPRGALRARAEAAGLACRLVSTANQLDLSASIRLAAQLRRWRPDVVHLHTPKDYLCGALASRLLRRPVLVLTRHMLLPVKHLMRRIYQRSDTVICLAGAIYEHMVREGVDASRLKRVGSGIDVHEFDTARTRSHRAELRGHWGAGAEDLVVGCVGRLVEGKGHSTLLQALRVALDRQDDGGPPNTEARTIRLVVLGEGPLRPALEAHVKKLGLTTDVHMAGFCSDVPSALSAMDALVVPSHLELMPLVVLEGMAAGLPVIATDVGAIHEIIEPGVTGLLVPAGDVRSLADALYTCASDTVLRLCLGRNGRARVETSHSITSMASATLEVYESLLEKRSIGKPAAAV